MPFNKARFMGSSAVALALLVGAVIATEATAQSSTDASAAMAPKEITFTSWVGPYMRSQMLGFVRPYEAETNSKVNVESYEGGIDEIRDQVESANVTWDVVDLTQADSLRACREGLLEDLSDIELPNGSDGTGFRDDFVDGALNECGVGVIVWGTAYAYNKDSVASTGDSPPSTIADFFDVKKYPGRRAISNDPSVVMEWATDCRWRCACVMSTATLGTPMRVYRAGVCRRMSGIKIGLSGSGPKGSEPIRLLNDGEVAMSMVWATTGATNAKKEGAKFDMVWDGRVIELDLFGIPKGSQNKDAAINFIRFASSSESLAKMVDLPAEWSNDGSRPWGCCPDDILAQLPNGPSYAGQGSHSLRCRMVVERTTTD